MTNAYKFGKSTIVHIFRANNIRNYGSYVKKVCYRMLTDKESCSIEELTTWNTRYLQTHSPVWNLETGQIGLYLVYKVSERKTCNWSHYNTNNLNLKKIRISLIVHQRTGTSMVELENTSKNCVNATLTKAIQITSLE